MTIGDEDVFRPQKTHEIGCDLTFLSADELASRITALKAEIVRLEQEITRKAAGRAAAESLFRS